MVSVPVSDLRSDSVWVSESVSRHIDSDQQVHLSTARHHNVCNLAHLQMLQTCPLHTDCMRGQWYGHPQVVTLHARLVGTLKHCCSLTPLHQDYIYQLGIPCTR